MPLVGRRRLLETAWRTTFTLKSKKPRSVVIEDVALLFRGQDGADSSLRWPSRIENTAGSSRLANCKLHADTVRHLFGRYTARRFSNCRTAIPFAEVVLKQLYCASITQRMVLSV